MEDPVTEEEEKKSISVHFQYAGSKQIQGEGSEKRKQGGGEKSQCLTTSAAANKRSNCHVPWGGGVLRVQKQTCPTSTMSERAPALHSP